MRLAAVCMLRNEADILPAFLGHCSALFDEVLVADHASCDGSTEILAAAARRMPLRTWRFSHAPQMQRQVVSALGAAAFEGGADWVFALDADEFPHVGSRAGLEARLPHAAPAAHWCWRNLWPAEAASFSKLVLNGVHQTQRATGPVRKVAASRVLHRAGGAVFKQGNHLLEGIETADTPCLGELLHVPVRHPDRLALKLRLGIRANRQRPDVRPRHAAHWERLVAEPDLSATRLRGIALGYPDAAVGAAPEPMDWSPLAVLEGLPAGLAEAASVAALDAEQSWAPLPDAPSRRWRVALQEGHVRIEAAPGVIARLAAALRG
jgi:glycosyltransferase involved in cell wall biosynthesis